MQLFPCFLARTSIELIAIAARRTSLQLRRAPPLYRWLASALTIIWLSVSLGRLLGSLNPGRGAGSFEDFVCLFDIHFSFKNTVGDDGCYAY